MTLTTVEAYKPSIIPSQHELDVLHVMAEKAVASKMYRGIGDHAGVMMIMLTARELGIPAMQALNGSINIIQGKVELSARLMNALMRRAGISVAEKESTNEACHLIGRRPNGDEMSSRFTLDEAKQAGLVKAGGNWVKHPQDMLFARAISRLARRLAPDIIGGCYVEGEIQDAVNITPTIEEIEPEEPITLQSLLDKFPEEDHQFVKDYLALFCEHFKKTEQEAVEICYKEPLIIEKIGNFKAKRVKNETS